MRLGGLPFTRFTVISCNHMQQIHFHRENRLNIGIYLLKHNYITLEQGVKYVQS